MTTQDTQILMKIAEDIGSIKGTVKEMKDQQVTYIAANDERHDKNEKDIQQLKDDKKKVIWTIGGLSVGGAFAGTKLGALINTFFGIAP